jgi:hypothetical protein
MTPNMDPEQSIKSLDKGEHLVEIKFGEIRPEDTYFTGTIVWSSFKKDRVNCTELLIERDCVYINVSNDLSSNAKIKLSRLMKINPCELSGFQIGAMTSVSEYDAPSRFSICFIVITFETGSEKWSKMKQS